MPLRLRLAPTRHDIAFSNELVMQPDDGPVIEPSALLVFTNRSGSNYLGDLLASTGVFSGFREILNDEEIHEFRPAERNLTTYGAYVRAQLGRGPAAPIRGMKASGRQLATLHGVGIVPRMMRPRIIHMRRRDVIAQAISLYIARKTGHWAIVPTTDIPYDGEAILDALQHIVTDETETLMILAVQQLPVLTVHYEDLMSRQPEVLGEIASFFSCGPLVPDDSALSFRIQRTAVNDSLRERFMADLAHLRFETLPPAVPRLGDDADRTSTG